MSVMNALTLLLTVPLSGIAALLIEAWDVDRPTSLLLIAPVIVIASIPYALHVVRDARREAARAKST